MMRSAQQHLYYYSTIFGAAPNLILNVFNFKLLSIYILVHQFWDSAKKYKKMAYYRYGFLEKLEWMLVINMSEQHIGLCLAP